MISVITPTVRAEMCTIVSKCLGRQTYKEFEWLIGSPTDPNFLDGEWIQDPDKKEGDFYTLNACWNKCFNHAQGELIVNITDGIWFAPDLLERLWQHYQDNPKSVVSAVGNQYDKIENGKPEHIVWRDPRMRSDFGSFYEVESTEIEFCIASFPKQAVLDIGGFDEEYDKGAALSEKEACLRMQKMGYHMYLDQAIEYRAIHHERLSTDWDKKYEIACSLYRNHVHEIFAGKRLKLDYL